MSHFLNLKDGKITVNTYRRPGAKLTSDIDLLQSVETDLNLTASLYEIEWRYVKNMFSDHFKLEKEAYNKATGGNLFDDAGNTRFIFDDCVFIAEDLRGYDFIAEHCVAARLTQYCADMY